MLKSILNNTFTTTCLCVILSAALWLPDLLTPGGSTLSGDNALMPLQSWLLRDLQLSGETGLWCALLFTMFSAILLFTINRRHLFAGDRENHLLLFYILLSSAMPSSLYFSGAQVASTGILLSVFFLFNTYQRQNALPALFASALFISLSGLFYLPAIGAALAMIISILASRPFIWRDCIAVIGGLLFPFFYLWLYYFLNDYAPDHFLTVLSNNIPPLYLPNVAGTFYEYLYIFTAGILFIWSLFAIKATGTLNKIKAVHMRQYFSYLLLCLLLSAVFFHPAMGSIMTLTAIPLAVMMASATGHIRKRKIYIFFLLVLLTAIIGSRLH